MRQTISLFLLISLIIASGCSKKNTPTSDNPLPITIQLKGGIEAESAGYYIALNKGFYLDEGLDVTLKPGGPQIQAEEPVLSGTVTFGVTWLPRLLVLRDQGKELVGFGQIVQKSSTQLIGKKSSGINRPIDLLHKRVSVRQEGTGYEFLIFLGENGVGAHNVQITPSNDPLKDILENKADMVALSSYQDFPVFLNQTTAGMDLLLYDGTTSSWGLPQDCLFTTAQYSKDHPEICAGILKATIKGWEYVLTNPKESASLLKDFDKTNKLDVDKEFQGIRDIAKLIKSTGTPGSTSIGSLNPAEFQRVNQLMAKYQIIQKPAVEQAFLFDLLKK